METGTRMPFCRTAAWGGSAKHLRPHLPKIHLSVIVPRNACSVKKNLFATGGFAP